MSRDRLTAEDKAFFHENGYLIGLPPVFSDEQVAELNDGLDALKALLHPDEDARAIREWHESSRFLFDICMNEQILDYVEGLIGPDFYLWASNFFEKPAHSEATVAWHQDAYYWPLTPPESLTVWLAFLDSDEGNGAMQVIPRSHRAGLLTHSDAKDNHSVLTLECESGQFSEEEAVPLVVKAGCISIHDDKIIHGSPANPSDRPRVALTIRYSKTKVKCDLSVNPHFKAYLCRGTDTYNHNPQGTPPTEPFARLDRVHKNVAE